MEVAERDDEQQAGGVADLGGRDDRRGRPRPAWKVARHLVQDRLRVVEVGDDGPGGHGDEDDEAPGQLPCAPGAVAACSPRCHRVRLPAARSVQGQTVPPRRLSAVTPISAVRISGTPMKASQIPKTRASTVMKAPMPRTKGQMLEPGKESMFPAPSAISASSRSRAGRPRVDLPQKKYLWPWKRRCQKK